MLPMLNAALFDEMEPAVRQSIEAAISAVEENPSAPQWGELGDRLLAHGLDAEAAESYRQAVALAPDDFDWNYLHAIATNSPTDFSKATSLRPQHALSWLRLGLAEQSAARHLEAMRAFTEATQRDPKLQRAQRGLGQSLLALDRFDEAIQTLTRALELDGADVGAWTALAQAYTATDDVERARQAATRGRFARRSAGFEDPIWLRHILEKGVSRSRRLELAQRRVGAADWSGAQDVLAELRGQRSDDADVEFLTAIVAANQGDIAGADSAFARSLAIQPDNVRAMLSWSQLYERRGDYDRALGWIETASSVSPRDPSIAMARMRNRRAAQDLDGVLLAIDQMLRINPGVTELEELREATAPAIASHSLN